MKTAYAYLLGFKDGFESPYELGSGLTWDDNDACNNAYDRGANHGQIVGAFVRFNLHEAQPFQDDVTLEQF